MTIDSALTVITDVLAVDLTCTGYTRLTALTVATECVVDG